MSLTNQSSGTQLTKERAVAHTTFTIERNYPTTPARAFAAFADPVKKRRWFAEGGFAEDDGFEVLSYELDFRVGGSESARFLAKGGPIAGSEVENYTSYHDIVPDQRIVLAYTMTVAGKRISASLVTFEFAAAGNGTELLFTEQAAFFEGADGPETRKGGWTALLDELGKELAR